MAAMTAESIQWGETPIQANRWHEIDDLWIAVDERPHETDVSYCHARPGKHGWRCFSALREVRVPVSTEFIVEQRLSPRPVVARPYKPVIVPAQRSVTLYVGTPLWLTLLQEGEVLIDVPVTRMSDTWFGVDTMAGEVCFDCQTRARTSMDGVRTNPFKAITPVVVHNDMTSPITIDRINLPVPHMSLFRGPERHWTSPLILHSRERWSEETNVRIEADPPPESPEAELVASPRVPLESGLLRKTMHLLLG